MQIVNITNARADLYNLVDTVNLNHEPALIKGKRCNAIMISEDDWKSLQETLYLASIPGMIESIKDGINTPIEECFDWKDINF